MVAFFSFINDYIRIYRPPERRVHNISNIIISEPHIHAQATQYPHSPVYLPWPPYGEPIHSGVQVGAEDFQTSFTSPTATTHSSESAVDIYTSSESSNSVVDDAIKAVKTKHREFPAKSPDGLSNFFPVVNAVPVSPVFSAPPTSYFGFYSSTTSRTSPRSSGSRSHSRTPSRQKAATYKSTFVSLLCGQCRGINNLFSGYTAKPCKFYKPDSSCPKGDQCTL